MKKYKNKILTTVIIISILTVSYVCRDNLSETADTGAPIAPTSVAEAIPKTDLEEAKKEIVEKDIEQPKANNTIVHNEVVETESTEVKEDAIPKLTCTMSVSCEAILENIDKLKPEKQGLVPKDGIIYCAKAVEFNEGESAFDLLLREMRNNNIHIEFEYTPAFDSTYIEGIGNLYEFDCGDMSGWLYKVNGKPADCGSSQYILSPDDTVEWVYTCR